MEKGVKTNWILKNSNTVSNINKQIKVVMHPIGIAGRICFLCVKTFNSRQ